MKPIVLTIGVFDGVHLGHQALIQETIQLAKKLKASPEVLTFQDHPAHVLTGAPSIPFLLPRTRTYAFLKKAGAKRIHEVRFTKAFSKKAPEQFVRWMAGLGKLKGVVVGENFQVRPRRPGRFKDASKFG